MFSPLLYTLIPDAQRVYLAVKTSERRPAAFGFKPYFQMPGYPRSGTAFVEKLGRTAGAGTPALIAGQDQETADLSHILGADYGLEVFSLKVLGQIPELPDRIIDKYEFTGSVYLVDYIGDSLHIYSITGVALERNRAGCKSGLLGFGSAGPALCLQGLLLL